MEDQGDFQAPQRQFNFSQEKVYIVSVLSFIVLFLGGMFVFLSQNNSELPEKIPESSPESRIFSFLNQSNKPQQKPQVAGESSGPQKPQPSPTPSPSKSPSPTPTPTPSPTPTTSPTPTPSPTPSQSSSSDTSGPNISEIKTEGVSSNSVSVKWKTNEDADSKVEYGKDTSYGQNKESSDKKQDHSIDLSGLDPNTTYHYRVISKDNSGNSTTSGDNTFTTLP